MQQEQVTMMKFRTRLEQLTLKKAAERGTAISQREIAETSGVPLTTLSRWYNKEFDRMDADTLYKLLDYFGCTFEELIERVPDEK